MARTKPLGTLVKLTGNFVRFSAALLRNVTRHTLPQKRQTSTSSIADDKQERETSSTETTILHISDLHFGWKFDEDSWTDLLNIARQLGPKIVLVTGDLVNSPHRLSLNWAMDELNSLQTMLECDLIVVPGNHDTRFLGLLPIKWVNPFGLLLLLALSLAIYKSGLLTVFPTLLWLILATVLVGLFLIRSLFFIDFNKKFKKFILPAPGFYSKYGLEIYAFDSASQALVGARGRIPKKQFVDAQGNLRKQLLNLHTSAPEQNANGSIAPYRIAILHHHPIPIPYDDANEPLMVADNAGTFLSEVSRLGVRLILHGHKHHKHFSRTTINAGGDDEHEIAVLSTGTATSNIGNDRREHHFYLLKLDGRGNMEVAPYLAEEGAAFQRQEPFLIEQSSLADKRLYEGTAQQCGLKCESNLLTVEITPDGDMDFRQEFHGFRVVRENHSVSGLPRPIEIQVGTGHIDDLSAGDLDANSGEPIQITEEIKELSHRKGEVSFGRNIGPQDQALNFYTHYVALNAFAMSGQQHTQMYGEPPPTEHLELALQPIPTQVLDFVVKLPAGFRISGEPRFFIEKDGRREPVLEQKLKGNLRYYPHLNVIVSTIPYPPLDLTYKLQWKLTEDAPPSGLSSISLTGETEELARGLLKLPDSATESLELKQLLGVIEQITRSHFNLDKSTQDPIEISLMAYDQEERTLKIVLANFEMTEQMRLFRLKYGDGIAGRAYKMNKGRMFIKRLAIQKNTPSYYYPLDGKPYDLRNINEEVIISYPLHHPENEELIYAVLSLSSKKPSSKLQNIKEPRLLEESVLFRKAVNKACFEILKRSILSQE